MAKKRETNTANDHIILTDQVNGICPLCTKSLTYVKNNKTYKNYDIAHIYPLNATMYEIEILKNEERLSNDLNSLENLIPLCKDCHPKFDKPRTVEEYRILLSIKKRIQKEQTQRKQWYDYRIETELNNILEFLAKDEALPTDIELQYDPKTIDEKLNDSILPITKHQIKSNVSEYYLGVKTKLKQMDKLRSDISISIALQVKLYYLKLTETYTIQQEIFDIMSDWINVKTGRKSIDASRVIISFFIQNCEVFE
jgi:hypothetical protein